MALTCGYLRVLEVFSGFLMGSLFLPQTQLDYELPVAKNPVGWAHLDACGDVHTMKAQWVSAYRVQVRGATAGVGHLRLSSLMGEEAAKLPQSSPWAPIPSAPSSGSWSDVGPSGGGGWVGVRASGSESGQSFQDADQESQRGPGIRNFCR